MKPLLATAASFNPSAEEAKEAHSLLPACSRWTHVAPKSSDVYMKLLPAAAASFAPSDDDEM
jgi:hypothetical protein